MLENQYKETRLVEQRKRNKDKELETFFVRPHFKKISKKYLPK